MRKVNINGTNNLVDIIKTKSTLGISNSKEYKFKLESILLQTLRDLREEALEYSLIQDRVRFMTDLKDVLLTEQEDLSLSDSPFLKVLNSVTEQFISEVEILISFFGHFPPSSQLSTDSIIHNTESEPLAFLKSLVIEGRICYIEKQFHYVNSVNGYSSDLEKNSVSTSFYVNDFDEDVYESLSMSAKIRYLKDFENPSNLIQETFYLKDDLTNITIQNIKISKGIIKSILQNKINENSILDQVILSLGYIVYSQNPDLKRYPSVLAKIKTFYKHIKRDGVDLFLNFKITTSDSIPTLTFRIIDKYNEALINSQGFQIDKNYILDFYNLLKERNWIDCTQGELFNILNGPKILKKIQWHSSLRSLKFIINTLYDNDNIISISTQHNHSRDKVIQNCFVDEHGNDFTYTELRGVKKPTNPSSLLMICANFV